MFKYILTIILSGCVASPEKREEQVAVRTGAAPAVNSANVASGEANRIFDNFIKAYKAGNVLECAEFFDQSMIGRQELIETLNKFKINQKLLSFYEKIFKIETLGDSTVVISIDWEKYSINLEGIEEKRIGKTIFFLQKKAGNQWKLFGQTGDNIFLP